MTSRQSNPASRGVSAMRRLRFPWVVAALLCLFLCPGVSWGLPRKNVLVLHNLSQDHPAIAAFDHGLLETLRASDRFDVRVAAEYVNVTAFEDVPSYLADTARYLEMKYTHWKPDLVFVDRAVMGLYAQYLGGLFKDAPLFVAQDRRSPGVGDASNRETISWGTTAADVVENLTLIRRLRPGTSTIFVVLGASEEERRLAAEVKDAADRSAITIPLVFTSDLSHVDLLQAVKAAPAGAAILYVRFVLDGNGVSFVPAKVLQELLPRCAAPVFVTTRHLLGEGTVGGYAASFELFGRRTALGMLEVFNGRKLSEALAATLTAPVSEYVFDWRALRRFGIPESALPPDSDVFFREETLWRNYKFYLLGGLVVVVAETLLVLGLVINRLRRRRAEAALAALNADLEARVAARTRELHEANEQLHDAAEELEVLNQSLTQLSRTDSLTGLPNRRHAEEALQDALVRFRRYGAGQGFVVVLADIDHFKRINDLYGHEAGDDLLRDVAGIMAGAVRQGDVASRWGGEEFLLLLPHTDIRGAGQFLERMREGIATAALRCGPARTSVTATFGAAEVRCGESMEDVVRRADAAMYQGKEQGRNRVVLDDAGDAGGA